MTVGELKKVLNTLDDNADIAIVTSFESPDDIWITDIKLHSCKTIANKKTYLFSEEV